MPAHKPHGRQHAPHGNNMSHAHAHHNTHPHGHNTHPRGHENHHGHHHPVPHPDMSRPSEPHGEGCCEVEYDEEGCCITLADLLFGLMCFSIFGVCLRFPCHPRNRALKDEHQEDPKLFCDLVPLFCG